MVSQSVDYDVVVCGAGIPGAALACALGQQGWNVALLDARPISAAAVELGEEYDPRVYAIAPASQKFLTELGVWPQIAAARISPYRQMQVWERAGVGELSFDAAEAGLAELGHIIEDRVITTALAQRLESMATVTLMAPAELLGFETQGQQISCELTDGQHLSAKLLVGADGADSKVRILSQIETVSWPYKQTAIVATVTTEKAHEETAWQRFLPAGPLAFLPLGDGRSSIVWSTTPERAVELRAMADAEFMAALGQASEDRLGAITATTTRLGFPLRLLHASQYSAARTVLIGDAAHSIHPLAGQGVNLGLADAYVLAQELGVAGAHEAGRQQPLRRYARRRKSENVAMLTVTDGLYRLFGMRSPLPTMTRNLGLALVNILPPVKHRLLRQAAGL